jgi:hypothetical protein
MLFPGEFSQWQYIPAFLFCAFTLLLAASHGWVQNIAYGTRSAGLILQSVEILALVARVRTNSFVSCKARLHIVGVLRRLYQDHRCTSGFWGGSIR